MGIVRVYNQKKGTCTGLVTMGRNPVISTRMGFVMASKSSLMECCSTDEGIGAGPTY